LTGVIEMSGPLNYSFSRLPLVDHYLLQPQASSSSCLGPLSLVSY